MASLLFQPGTIVLNNNGKPEPGAKVYVYDAGTTDLASIFENVGLSVAHDNPVIADSAGRLANIYVAGDQNYKVIVTTSTGTSLFTSDNIPPTISNASGTLPVANGGTGASTASGARTALGAAAASDLSTLSTNLSSATTAQDTTTWETGTGTTETTVSPAKIKAAISANESTQSGVPDAVLWDEKAIGVSGGDFAAGSWVTRTLNTSYDTGSVITLSSNQFTPSKDGYVEFSVPGHECGSHQARLFNVTDNSVVRYGTSEKLSASSVQSRSVGWGVVVADKAYKIEHRCSSAKNTDGLGSGNAFAPSIFTQVKFFSNHGE